MKIAVYARPNMTHQMEAGRAFCQGLARHGHTVCLEMADRYAPCDLAVIWSHRRRNIIEGQRAAGGDYLVMERGYAGDRMAHVSMGFNGLNGRAEYPDWDDGGARWRALGIELAPWRREGDYALIMGQVAGDASLAGLNPKKWAEDIAPAVEAAFGLPVFFRPHPGGMGALPDGVARRPLSEDLSSALSGAAVAVTFNSNSGVDAAIAGVPVVALDAGSMALPVAAHWLEEGQLTPPREAWAHALARRQWTLSEIASGEAWDRLKSRYC